MLSARGVRVGGAGAETVRIVTHLDVSRADCERAVKAVGDVCRA